MRRLLNAWRIARLRRSIVSIVEDRDRFVNEHELDPSFCFGDANWGSNAKNDYLNLYGALRDCPAHLIEDRFVSLRRNFSGYRFPATIPADDLWVTLWRKYTLEIPARYLYVPPPIHGEIGPVINGIIVNYDTYVYQERINLLFESGILQNLEKRRSVTILELGGGYGALSLALKRILPRARYIICDLPESLLFSVTYLNIGGIAPCS